MIQKPDTIYTTEETTTKKFYYGKPDGWDKKKPPQINPKKFKMKWWMIVRDVWRGMEDIEPKYLMRYDGWMNELKIIAMTVFITFCLTYMVFHSPLVSATGANEADNERKTWLDKGIDYVFEKYDDWRGVKPIVKPDTIYQVKKDTMTTIVPLLTQEQLDSIINSYNQSLDSLQASDSTAKIE